MSGVRKNWAIPTGSSETRMPSGKVSGRGTKRATQAGWDRSGSFPGYGQRDSNAMVNQKTVFIESRRPDGRYASKEEGLKVLRIKPKQKPNSELRRFTKAATRVDMSATGVDEDYVRRERHRERQGNRVGLAGLAAGVGAIPFELQARTRRARRAAGAVGWGGLGAGLAGSLYGASARERRLNHEISGGKVKMGKALNAKIPSGARRGSSLGTTAGSAVGRKEALAIQMPGRGMTRPTADDRLRLKAMQRAEDARWARERGNR